MRTSWDDLWMRLAQDVGTRSRCVRRQAGAVIVTPDNKPIAVGYNGPAAGWAPDGHPTSSITGERLANSPVRMPLSDNTTCDSFCPRTQTGGQTANYDDCVTVHAEANALLWAAGRDVTGAMLYVYPGVPCLSCAKLIAGAGIARVYVVTHPVDNDRNVQLAYDYMRQSRVRCIELGPR